MTPIIRRSTGQPVENKKKQQKTPSRQEAQQARRINRMNIRLKNAFAKPVRSDESTLFSHQNLQLRLSKVFNYYLPHLDVQGPVSVEQLHCVIGRWITNTFNDLAPHETLPQSTNNALYLSVDPKTRKFIEESLTRVLNAQPLYLEGPSRPIPTLNPRSRSAKLMTGLYVASGFQWTALPFYPKAPPAEIKTEDTERHEEPKNTPPNTPMSTLGPIMRTLGAGMVLASSLPAPAKAIVLATGSAAASPQTPAVTNNDIEEMLQVCILQSCSSLGQRFSLNNPNVAKILSKPFPPELLGYKSSDGTQKRPELTYFETALFFYSEKNKKEPDSETTQHYKLFLMTILNKLKTSAQLDACFSSNYMLTHLVKSNEVWLIQTLIDKGINLKSDPKYSEILLHARSDEMIHLLLQNNCIINANHDHQPETQLETQLSFLIRKGLITESSLRLFFEKGQDLSRYRELYETIFNLDDEETKSKFATILNEILLEQRFKTPKEKIVFYINKYKYYPQLSKQEIEQIQDILAESPHLKLSAEIKKELLFMATQTENLSFVKFLLSHLNHPNLHLSLLNIFLQSESFNIDIIDLILEKTDIYKPLTEPINESLLEIARKAVRNYSHKKDLESHEKIKLLIAKRVVKQDSVNTALGDAVEDKNPQLVTHLLKKSNPKPQVIWGESEKEEGDHSPLAIALENENFKIIKLLLEKIDLQELSSEQKAELICIYTKKGKPQDLEYLLTHPAFSGSFKKQITSDRETVLSVVKFDFYKIVPQFLFESKMKQSTRKAKQDLLELYLGKEIVPAIQSKIVRNSIILMGTMMVFPYLMDLTLRYLEDDTNV